ncbi:helix-turn-helix domain-containing protein, partial [Brevibacterium sp. FME37]
ITGAQRHDWWTPAKRIFSNGAVQFERWRTLEPQREVIELAKAQSVYQRKLTDEDVQACRARAGMGISVAEAARRYAVSRQTLYNAIKGTGACSPDS